MKLLEFPHSHFCEKARWALDFKGLSFDPVPILPGFHLRTVRRYAPKTFVPVLLHNNEAIQGSSTIIDCLDEHYQDYPLTPRDEDLGRLSCEIEAEMDEKLGRPIRQILYYWLLDYPGFIRHCFAHSLPVYKQLVFRLTYPVLRKIMYRTYVISTEKVDEARCGFSQTLSELADTLNNRKYLVGDQFSRADLTVASMLCLLVLPSEHPLPWINIPDSRVTQFIDEYENHPVSQWVRTMYRVHRKPDRTGFTQSGGVA